MTKAVMMLVVVALVVAVMSLGGAWADNCDIVQLTVCLPAVTGGSEPTAECCSNLRAQQGCFCQFTKDPTYGKYVGSPNALTVLKACGIPTPSC